MGDSRWLDLHEKHEALMRSAVRKFRGTFLRSMGDGFVVTFGSSAAGVLAATDVIAGMRALGIELRAAVHIGDCELRGRRPGGIVFNVCARIIALAEPNEILVSRTVRDVAAGSSLTFKDRGAHVLRGVPGRWELYRALASREAIDEPRSCDLDLAVDQ
jgi:class 3 adenylate cyclase